MKKNRKLLPRKRIQASAYAAIVAITIGKIVAGSVMAMELMKYGRTPALKDSVPSPKKTPL